MKKRTRRRGHGAATRERHREALKVLRSFRVIYGSVRQHFRAVEERCGVSGSQLWILREVQQERGIGVSALAVKLGIHQSTSSQLVEKLVRSGHLSKSRSTEDQRRVGLTLTRKGVRAMERAPGPAEGVLPEALGELSTASLRTLHLSLKQVIKHLDVQVPEAAEEPLANL